MKLKLKTMTAEQRICSLVFDEMAIKKHLDYNKRTDSIDGLCPDGSPARQAMVFMVRAISGKWKQVRDFKMFSADDNYKNELNELKKEHISLFNRQLHSSSPSPQCQVWK